MTQIEQVSQIQEPIQEPMPEPVVEEYGKDWEKKIEALYPKIKKLEIESMKPYKWEPGVDLTSVPLKVLNLYCSRYWGSRKSGIRVPERPWKDEYDEKYGKAWEDEIREQNPGIKQLEIEAMKPIKWRPGFDMYSIPNKVLTRFCNIFWGSKSGGAPKKMRPCPFCEEEIEAGKIRKHVVYCEKKPENVVNIRGYLNSRAAKQKEKLKLDAPILTQTGTN